MLVHLVPAKYVYVNQRVGKTADTASATARPSQQQQQAVESASARVR